MSKPNILFLMTDQQRFDHLGITNPVVKTPNLDALAAKSVFFTHAYSTNPACVPARAAIFTGRYPSQTGVPHNTTCLPGTWLAAAGLPIPKPMRSRDLSPYWRNTDHLDDRELVYMEANQVRGIRTHRWKFIHCHGSSEGELYDLIHDPDEINNLWDAPDKQSLKAELTRQLLDHVIGLGGNFHVPCPGWTTPRNC